MFGGVSINPQIDALRRGCDLLVATPGRLLDLAEQRAVDLRNVQCFVLDEADRMLDMGFIAPIRRIIKLLPAQRQNLMFSATYSEEIRELASRILRNPGDHRSRRAQRHGGQASSSRCIACRRITSATCSRI